MKTSYNDILWYLIMTKEMILHKTCFFPPLTMPNIINALNEQTIIAPIFILNPIRQSSNAQDTISNIVNVSVSIVPSPQ